MSGKESVFSFVNPMAETYKSKNSEKKPADLEPWVLDVRLNEGVHNQHGHSNAISTTKYSVITWLPKSLWEQFRRVANVYFVVISVLMFIGTYATYIFLTPLNPWSTVATLVFVLMVTSIKEGVEDLGRARSDRDENCRKLTVVTFSESEEIIETVKETQYVKAGDIIKLTGQMPVPADMIIIMTSMYEDGNQCYIETSNIDGETNLKLREAPSQVRDLAVASGGVPTPAMFKGKLEIEQPNKNIHNFIAALHLEGVSEQIPLGPENLMLRSALFCNTDWAYGIAVYTGQETKIQMNNRLAPSKMSKLENYLNIAILIIFISQVVLVCFSVGSIYIMGYQNYSELPYVFDGKGSSSVLPLWLEQWFVFFLLYNNFIPISLYVTIELVNIGQAYLVASDAEMYDEPLDCPCNVRSSNLVQELGQVSNIFSDKTGTLTRNEMKFVKFIVDGQVFDVNSEYHHSSQKEQQKQQQEDGEEEQLTEKELLQSQHVRSEHVMAKVNSDPAAKNGKLYGFFRCLTTCHTVIREKNGTYRAESPDELALIEGVGNFQCGLTERGTTAMKCEMFGENQTYEILAVNAFNSDRKRMSIIVRETSTNEYFIMCKGADSTMLPLCDLDSHTRKNIDKSLMDLACMGLRTLCIAHKRLDAETAQAWLGGYKTASAALQNRAEKLAAIAAEIEQSMSLLGITAIEDRLQDEVPEVIADLAKAGIILWMLTGDKEETAINIGYSCNLLTPTTKTHFLTRLASKEDYAAKLKSVYDDITENFTAGVGYRHEDGRVSEQALVMDGPSFENFQADDPEQRAQLLKIGQSCRSVVACRLTPIQKQQVVNVVKKDTVPKAITLSIGDGANDVSMIREADVGVGIYGKEGRQAANSADFAIGQFKFLRRLLLVHGRYNYVRQSRVFLYSMHKNMVITLTLFWYSYFTAVSGTSLYESWVYSSFNIVLGLPIIFYGILDRDISIDFAIKNPQTYITGRSNTYLQVSSICMWIWNALLYAVVLCLLFYYSIGVTFKDYGLYEMGTTVFVGLCNALQLKAAYLHHQWAYPHLISMGISVGGMLLFFAIISSLDYLDFYYISNFLYSDGVFWLFGFFFVPVFVVLIDVIGHNLYLFFLPKREMLFREIELKEQFENDLLVKHSLGGGHHQPSRIDGGGGALNDGIAGEEAA